MSKYLETKKGSIENAVLEAMSPAQQAAIAISKKEKGEKPKKEKDEGNAFGAALKAAKEKGDDTFVVAGKKYDVKTEQEVKEFVQADGEKRRVKEGDNRLKANRTEKKLDKVNPDAVKKKFDDRKDKDIDNDGDVDSSDKFLHKRRKAISKAVKSEELEEGRMKELHGLIAKGHSAQEIAKKMKLDVKTIEALMDDYDADKDHTKDPKSHIKQNKETGMFCVYDMKGKKVAEFKTKEEAEEYAKKHHDKLMNEEVVKEDVNSLAMQAARAIAKMWEDSAKTKEAKVKEEEEPKKKESKTAMTGKPMAGVEVNPKESKDK